MMTVTAINSLNPNTVTNNINFTAESKNSATKPAANTKAASAKKHKKTSKALETTIDLATFGAAGALGIMGYKGKWLQKGIKWLSDTKFMNKKVFPNYEIDNAKFMSLIGVTSIVLKDGLGCYLYVKQSLNNDKIPEDKRKFVAALDLANGGLMVAMQLLTFFTISSKKVQTKLFNSLFGEHFTRSAKKALKFKLKQNSELTNMSGKEFYKAREKDLRGLIGAFGYLTSLAASAIIAKRVIVPFIATPLADKTKAWMCRNDKPAQTHKDTKNTYDTSKPAAQNLHN